MAEFLIEMRGVTRSDGSVFVTSPELPMFSVIGKSEQEAFDLAIAKLNDYLEHNVPEFVELRVVPAGTNIIPHRSSSDSSSPVLPAHVIATTRGRVHAGIADS